jgi:hypothetical protein
VKFELGAKKLAQAWNVGKDQKVVSSWLDMLCWLRYGVACHVSYFTFSVFQQLFCVAAHLMAMFNGFG